VSNFLLRRVLSELHQTHNYGIISFNIMSKNYNLKKIVERGFIGEVLNKIDIFKSYKKIGEKN